MEARELLWIKQRQREFQQLFGKKLEVDLVKMNRGVNGLAVYEDDQDEIKRILRECLEKHKASIWKIRRTKNITAKMHNEYNALAEYGYKVREHFLSQDRAASFIKKERSAIYGYAKRYRPRLLPSDMAAQKARLLPVQ